jgi:hypothetical protein
VAELANLGDVEAIWQRQIPEDDREPILRLLAYAQARIRHLVPTIDTRVTDGTLSRDVVAPVIGAMVVRAAANPAHLVGSKAAGGVSITFDQAVRAGLDPTASELEILLAPAVNSGQRGWGTIRATPGMGYSDSCGTWIPDYWMHQPRTRSARRWLYEPEP